MTRPRPRAQTSDHIPRIGQAPRRRRRPNRWLMLGLLALGVYVLISFSVQQVKLYRVGRQIALVQQEIAQEQARQAELQQQVDALQTDEYVERVAREKLGLVKPGEIPYVAVPAGAGN